LTPDDFEAANDGTRRSGLKIRAPLSSCFGLGDYFALAICRRASKLPPAMNTFSFSFSTLAAAVLGLSLAGGALRAAGAPVPGGWDKVKGKRILYFTKSSGFEHSVVKRPAGGQLSHSEKILTELGQKHGFEVVCTKDGTVFTPENIAKYDVFVFFTSGDLLTPGTDKTPAMTPAGKAALLEAIRKRQRLRGHPRGQRQLPLPA
jgi:hypothetical protein